MNKYINTFSGIKIDPENVKANDICIEDIAMGLSMECRYTGQLGKFLSVAEHSVWVSKMVNPKHAFFALMHDASEAYVGDLISPIKGDCLDFQQIEARFHTAINEHFGFKLTSKCIDDVDYWDKACVIDEKLLHMDFWTPDKAHKEFMARFKQLTKGIK